MGNTLCFQDEGASWIPSSPSFPTGIALFMMRVSAETGLDLQRRAPCQTESVSCLSKYSDQIPARSRAAPTLTFYFLLILLLSFPGQAARHHLLFPAASCPFPSSEKRRSSGSLFSSFCPLTKKSCRPVWRNIQKSRQPVVKKLRCKRSRRPYFLVRYLRMSMAQATRMIIPLMI